LLKFTEKPDSIAMANPLMLEQRTTVYMCKLSFWNPDLQEDNGTFAVGFSGLDTHKVSIMGNGKEITKNRSYSCS